MDMVFECVGNVAYFGRLFPFEKGEYLLLPGVEVDGRAGLCDRRYRGRCGLGGYVLFRLVGAMRWSLRLVRV